MDLLSTVLGAALAVGGGFIAQHYEQVLRRQREDRLILLGINDCLLDLNAVLRDGGYPGAAKTTTQAQNEALNQGETVRLLGRLSKLALKLQRPEYRGIAVKATKIALDSEYRTEGELYALTRAVQLKVNAKVITEYEAGVARQDA